MPSLLLKDCVRVDLGALSTNGDMARALVAQDESLASCNEDKAAIRRLMPPEATGKAAKEATEGTIPDKSEGK